MEILSAGISNLLCGTREGVRCAAGDVQHAPTAELDAIVDTENAIVDTRIGIADTENAKSAEVSTIA
jgi:hypothetical protein